MKVTKEILVNFDGQQVMVGALTFLFNEHMIATAIGLLRDGENWFKGLTVKPKQCNQFLMDDHQNPNWSKDISRSWVKHEFHDFLYLVKKYITCEGRFTATFLYHMRFLLHLYDNQKMNLSFFLWRSLTKMDLKVKGKIKL